jgi:tRNA threonylcarbamoyladenosine biosynthesis protein TsaB
MRILALETSTGSGSLALLEPGRVVLSHQLTPGQRTAQTFAPALDAALRQADWEPRSVALVAVTHGPGSFTGLRIGVTAARFFAYAVGAELLAVNTLDVIVAQLPQHIDAAWAIMDAQRGQWFAACYRRLPDGTWQVVAPCQVWSSAALAQRLSPDIVLTGPGLARAHDPFVPGEQRADPTCWNPRAETLGHLARLAYDAGQRGDLWRVEPQYYRPSYAEEKRGS